MSPLVLAASHIARGGTGCGPQFSVGQAVQGDFDQRLRCAEGRHHADHHTGAAKQRLGRRRQRRVQQLDRRRRDPRGSDRYHECCDHPENVPKPRMTAEDAFLTTLHSAQRWRIDGKTADHRRRGGASAVDGSGADKHPRNRLSATALASTEAFLSACALQHQLLVRRQLAVCRRRADRRCAGALYWPEQGLLAVADLHLEKGSSFARAAACCCRPMTRRRRWRGSRALIARYAPRVVVALGDSFHDGRGPARLADTDRASLRRPAARPRLDLDRRQPRSRAGRRHRRAVSSRRSRSARSRSATSRRETRRAARSPAICIRLRGLRGAAARSAAAALPPTASGW